MKTLSKTALLSLIVTCMASYAVAQNTSAQAQAKPKSSPAQVQAAIQQGSSSVKQVLSSLSQNVSSQDADIVRFLSSVVPSIQSVKYGVSTPNDGICKDENGQDTDVAKDSSQANVICVSAGKMTLFPVATLNKQAVAMLAHGIALQNGFSAESAKNIGAYVFQNATGI